MLANNANDSIPAWKLPLLERRRQQAELERQAAVEETTRMSQVPEWKKDLKKRIQQKEDDKSASDRSIGEDGVGRCPAFRKHENPEKSQFRRSVQDSTHEQSKFRDSNPAEKDYSVISDIYPGESERLLPIQRNPILQSDLKRRTPHTRPQSAGNKSVDESSRQGKNPPVICNGNGYSVRDDYDLRYGKLSDDEHKDSDDQEEMTYGRGFVSKLLGRFKDLSRKNHASASISSVPKRTCSTDNILSDILYENASSRNMPMTGNLKYSKGKARSMDNLLMNVAERREAISSDERPRSIANGFLPAKMPSVAKTPIASSSVAPSSAPKQFSNKSASTAAKGQETVTGGGGGKKGTVPYITLTPSSTPPTGIIRESSPLPEDELPRSNIVLLTRTVFESIGVSPPIEMSNTKKKLTGDRANLQAGNAAPRFDQLDGSHHTSSEPGFEPKSFHSASRTHDTVVNCNANISDRAVESSVGNRGLGNTSSDFGRKNQTTGAHGDVVSSTRVETASNLPLSGHKGPAPGISAGHLGGARNSSLNESAAVASQGRHGFEKSSSSQSFKSQSEESETSTADDSSVKLEANRQHLILDLKDLPPIGHGSTSKSELLPSNGEARSTEEDGSRKKGPGSLLIRPASNLLSSSMKVEYLNLTKYNDIKTGEFAPPTKRPSYYDDDAHPGVPITNLDDVMNDDDYDRSAPKEGDPSIYKSHTVKFEFEGAGVRVGRSLLDKTKDNKSSKIRFNDSAEQTFEYPSEQTMLDDWFESHSDDVATNDEDESDEDDAGVQPKSSLKSTPGLGSSGSLSSYKTRLQVDYEIGMERRNDAVGSLAPSSDPSKSLATDDSNTVTMPDESSAWSNSASSDLLF